MKRVKLIKKHQDEVYRKLDKSLDVDIYIDTEFFFSDFIERFIDHQFHFVYDVIWDYKGRCKIQ